MKIRLNPNRHCAGFLGIGESHSSQQSTAQQVGASEGSLAVGAGAKYIEGGGVDLYGSSGAKLGTDISAGQNVNITTNDADLLKAALEGFRDQSLSSTSAFSSFAKQIEEQKSDDLATALGSIGQLKQTTDEAAQQRKTFLYLVLGILALLGVLFFPWRNIR